MDTKVIVRLKDLPAFSDLTAKVNQVVMKCSWWEQYGWEWVAFALCVLAAPYGFSLLRSNSLSYVALGMFILGSVHSVLANRLGHLATHGALCRSKRLNKFLAVFFVEFIGSFSEDLGVDIHIKTHHPHTNIIGLGDSSTWKAPFVPCYLYMFITPLIVPLITPAFAIAELIRTFRFKKLLRPLVVIPSGLALHLYILTQFCGLSFAYAFVCLFAFRAIWATSYIHINIFQHIGLPMYSQEARPVRIYQMSTGVLNLSRNPLLDVVFGHTLMSCHVEHHLFPRLADNMCLKIQPIVKEFLLQNGLPYNEEPYSSRLLTFVRKYEEYMVNAPPITHFIGLQ